MIFLNGREVRGDHPEADENWLCWRADHDPAVETTSTSRRERTCLDCSQRGDYAAVDEHGTVHGWLCFRCDSKRQLKQIG
jgi:hypothetical protein